MLKYTHPYPIVEWVAWYSSCSALEFSKFSFVRWTPFKYNKPRNQNLYSSLLFAG